MPEGSSSEAPVINPGPSILRNLLRGFLSSVIAASSEAVPPAGSACGISGFPGRASISTCSLRSITCCRTNLAERLKFVRRQTRLEDIAFAAAGVDQFDRVLLVDL